MPTHPLWSDDYWPLIMQLYMSKPTGIKPLYSRPVVDLGIRLHIPPKFIFAQMHLLREHATPFLQRLWDTYAGNTSRLNRDVRRLRQMSGFGAESAFYDGVSIDDDFADDFRPIADDTKLTRVMLIIILDLYFRLTPITMVCETPEVGECASLLGIKPQKVVEVLCIYQTFDPILHRAAAPDSPLSEACRTVWQRFRNEEPDRLANRASLPIMNCLDYVVERDARPPIISKAYGFNSSNFFNFSNFFFKKKKPRALHRERGLA